ncbi:hypothetical protein C8R45DRAFT_364647 [Mycena sanguinolenta]|nr:hypothetical protein C8R45DRAFT_364647 [Mycena sanguinolenta]
MLTPTATRSIAQACHPACLPLHHHALARRVNAVNSRAEDHEHGRGQAIMHSSSHTSAHCGRSHLPSAAAPRVSFAERAKFILRRLGYGERRYCEGVMLGSVMSATGRRRTPVFSKGVIPSSVRAATTHRFALSSGAESYCKSFERRASKLLSCGVCAVRGAFLPLLCSVCDFVEFCFLGVVFGCALRGAEGGEDSAPCGISLPLPVLASSLSMSLEAGADAALGALCVGGAGESYRAGCLRQRH